MAILWHEMWHEALEEASRQYFGESNVEAMLATLMPLHEMMARNGPTTLKEIAFVQVRLSFLGSSASKSGYHKQLFSMLTVPLLATLQLSPCVLGAIMLVTALHAPRRSFRSCSTVSQSSLAWSLPYDALLMVEISFRRMEGSSQKHTSGARGTGNPGEMQSCIKPGTCTTMSSSASTSSFPP